MAQAPGLERELADEILELGDRHQSDAIQEFLVRFAQERMPRFAEVNPAWQDGGPVEPVTLVMGFFEESRPVVLTYRIPDLDLQAHLPIGFVLVGSQVGLRNPHEYFVINGDNEINVPLTMRAMIARESVVTPDRVGGANDIIILTSDGAEWIDKKPECRDRE